MEKRKSWHWGAFPDVGLKAARDGRDEARSLLAAGIDPGQKKKADKQARALQVVNTFQAVADEFVAKWEREGLAPVTLAKARWLLDQLAGKSGAGIFNTWIGHIVGKGIVAPLLL